jgi:protein O-GlcNAc transferase
MNANPDEMMAYFDRGNALQDLGRYEAAIASYDQLLYLKPNSAGALVNRSNALRALRQLDRALEDVDAALSLRPAFAEALNSRGNLLRDLERLEEAVACFDQALVLKPQFHLARCNRGKALLDLKQARHALLDFETVLSEAVDHVEALFGRASALLLLQQRLDQAAADFARAAQLGIDRVETLVGEAAALAGMKRHTEAAVCLAELLTLAPDRDYARGSMLHSRLRCCDWADLPSQVELLRTRVAQGGRATLPQSLLSFVDAPDLQLACARTFGSERYAGRSELGELMRRGERSGERIRVAYVSADFCEHPVSRLLVGVLERHAREGFELIGVSLREAAVESSDFERRVRSGFDQWIELGGATDRQLAQRLRELGVDIAVDLMGYTQGLRLGIFAHRAAPVQVNFLGYAGTLGVPYMDYILADEVVIPPGEERHYSEQVVRLPHSYLPHDDRRELAVKPSRSEAGLPDEGFVFCAFTNAYKINPPVFEVWMRLLRETPGSVLWLRGIAEEARKNLEREAQSRGVQAHRLVYAPHVAGMGEHLARQSLADLYLDTLPYNAHSTAVDALWAGVPVLTCAGRSFASRVAASALTAVGLEGLITQDLEQYERRGLELTRDPEQLRSLRSRLESARASAPLFDTARYTRDLEDAFRYMHQRALSAQAPLSIDLAPAALSGRVPVRIGAAPT